MKLSKTFLEGGLLLNPKPPNMMTQDIKREDSYPKGTTSEYIKNPQQKERKKWWHFGM